jgi:hypothetical protein
VFVSSKTQAVIDAYEETADKYKALAAALRAIASQGVFADVAVNKTIEVVPVAAILATADELESL